MSNKVITLDNGIPKKTSVEHYNKTEVDNIISAKEADSIAADSDTLTAAMDYTDTKVAEIFGGVTPETLDTIAEIAAALESEQTATGSILTTLGDHSSELSSLGDRLETLETSTALADEISARQSADATLQSNINDEQNARIAGDAASVSAAATDATNKANAAQAYAIQRSNHTGTQGPATIVQDSSNRFTTDAEKATWNAKQAALGFTPENVSNKATTLASPDDVKFPTTKLLNDQLALKVDKVAGKQLSTEDYSTAEKTKLSGIATGATANSTDVELRDRSTHTGTQLASTISNFASTVLAAVITGLSTASSATITASDSILSALGKLQAQATLNATNIANIVSTFGSTVRSTVLTGISFATSTAVDAGDSLIVALGKIQAQITRNTISLTCRFFPTGRVLLANTTTTFTVDTCSVHIYHGSTAGQIIALPNATTLPLGQYYEIHNTGSSNITVNMNGGALALVIAPTSKAYITLSDNSTAAGLWSSHQVTTDNTASGLLNYSVSSATSFGTTSTTDVVITGFTVTPAQGTYAVFFDASVNSSSNNSKNIITIYKNGVAHTPSMRTVQGVGSSFDSGGSTMARITFNGTESCDVRIRTTGGTFTVTDRTLILMRLGV